MKPTLLVVTLVLWAMILSSPLLAAENEAASAGGESEPTRALYRVQFFRTESFVEDDFLRTNLEMIDGGFFEGWSVGPPMLASKILGDRWDLLSIHPMVSYGDYFSDDRLQIRREAHSQFENQLETLASDIEFAVDLFAVGPAISLVQNAFATNSFVVVHSYQLKPGKRDELLDQLFRWNEGRVGSDQDPLFVFVSDGGADIDVVVLDFAASPEEFTFDCRNAGGKSSTDEYAGQCDSVVQRGIVETTHARTSSIARIARQ